MKYTIPILLLFFGCNNVQQQVHTKNEKQLSSPKPVYLEFSKKEPTKFVEIDRESDIPFGLQVGSLSKIEQKSIKIYLTPYSIKFKDIKNVSHYLCQNYKYIPNEKGQVRINILNVPSKLPVGIYRVTIKSSQETVTTPMPFKIIR